MLNPPAPDPRDPTTRSPHSVRLLSGVYFNPLDPTPEAVAHVTWADVAWGLANTYRFAGQTVAPISVAAHTLCVLSAARRLARPSLGHLPKEADPEAVALDRRVARAALLHDASEAFLGDIPTPFKRHPTFAAVAAAESRLQAALNVRFGAGAEDHHLPAVAEGDRFALAVEAWLGHGVDVREWGYTVPERWYPLRDLAAVSVSGPYDYSRGRGGYTSDELRNFEALLNIGCMWGLCDRAEVDRAHLDVEAPPQHRKPAPWWPEGGAP